MRIKTISKQDYGTPNTFIEKVDKRFGPITIDLAAHYTNHVVDIWFGPRSNYHLDSLSMTCRWREYNGLLWLNPPYENISEWAEKCWIESNYGAKIALLTTASVNSCWFEQYIFNKALVLFIKPRLKFNNCEYVFPTDLMLSIYGEKPGFEIWNWKK